MNIEKKEQALILSTKKIGEARQGSASPDWMIEPDAEAYQGEQLESSRQHSHNKNSELMEMLRKMDQRMLERDSQLKVQLKMRDQFFEAEIRKRDRFMDEAIKQRDEKWREELEKRDEMWRNELRRDMRNIGKRKPRGMVIWRDKALQESFCLQRKILVKSYGFL